MKLVIDIGNTRTKIAVFSEASIVFYRAYSSVMINDIEEVLTNFPDVKKAIFSTVGIHSQTTASLRLPRF